MSGPQLEIRLVCREYAFHPFQLLQASHKTEADILDAESGGIIQQIKIGQLHLHFRLDVVVLEAAGQVHIDSLGFDVENAGAVGQEYVGVF